MSESALDENASVESLVSRVADEFVQRLEHGEQPRIEEFTGRHPEIANVLRQILPALALLRCPGQKIVSADGLASSPALGFLGDYQLCREVGRGGMGIVYEAEQISLGRRVALKVLPLAAALDAKQLQRFKLEAQAAAHLHHTNIVPVFSVGCERGVHYYAMQYIEGRSLADVIGAMRESEAARLDLPKSQNAPEPAVPRVLPGAPFSSTEAAALSTKHSIRSPIFIGTAARLGAQAAEALEYAHQMGVVHRDIKPANLMTDTRGNVLITDFGLARYHNDAALTMTGDMLGTLRYMSPEQALAKPIALDHRTDIYSLGATLYELLTLEPAFGGRDRGEVLRRIAWEEPKPLRQINPAIPIELETIVLKAIAKSPTDRYATAQDLAEDLARFLQDEPIRAKRPTLIQRTKRWARRHQPIVWSAGVSMTLLVAAALVGLTISNFLISQERVRTLQQNHKAQQAEVQAKRRLFDARLAQARASRFSRQVGQRFESWRVLTEAAQLAGELNLDETHWLDLRDEAIACLALTDLRVEKQCKGFPPGSSGNVAFDSGLERYARSDLLGNISVRRLTDDLELIRLPGLNEEKVMSGDPDVNLGAAGMRFHPGGNLLAATYWRRPGQESPNFRLWDLPSRTAIYEPPFQVRGFTFSPDGRYLALGLNNGLVIREVSSEMEVLRREWGRPVETLAFHPDGTQLAIAHFQRTEVEVRDVASGTVLKTLHFPVGSASLSWHPDGVLLAAGGTDHRIYLWNTATDQQHAVLHGHQNTVVSVCFAPGGDLLLSCAWDGTSRLWDPWTGRELLSFPGVGYCFSADGHWLGSRAGWNVSVWELGLGRGYRTLRRSPERTREGFQNGDFSPDGRWLVTASREGVGLWDLEAGRESRLLTSNAVDVKFHPNGKELFVSGESGIYRWPIEWEQGAPRLSNSIKLPVAGMTYRMVLHPNERLLTVINYRGAQTLDLEQPTDQGKNLEHKNAVSLATSPDGKWIATGTFNGFGVRIWDTNSGRIETKMIHDAMSAMVAFSPDGRYLVTGTATEFSFWNVGTWQLARQIPRDQGVESPGEMVFSPDGEWLAISLSPSVTQIIEAATGRRIAKLQSPDTDQVFVLGFTPDSSQLIVSTAAGSIRVWDLRRIRTQLQELGLDWNLATK